MLLAFKNYLMWTAHLILSFLSQDKEETALFLSLGQLRNNQQESLIRYQQWPRSKWPACVPGKLLGLLVSKNESYAERENNNNNDNNKRSFCAGNILFSLLPYKISKNLHHSAYYASPLILKCVHSVITGQTVCISVSEGDIRKRERRKRVRQGP